MKKIILIALFGYALVACNKQEQEQEQTTEVSLELLPTVSGAQSQTRALVEGGTFETNNEIGFSLFETGSIAEPHLPGYQNIRGVWNNAAQTGKCKYYVSGLYMGRSLAGKTTLGNIDVYGYHPYSAAMSDITAVLFAIGTTDASVTTATEAQATTDYMYADKVGNKDIGALADSEFIEMKFHHIMTALRFKLWKKYYGPYLTVESITFKFENINRLGDYANGFVVGGVYDATNKGTIIPSEYSKEIVVNYNKTLANTQEGMGNNIVLPIAIPPLLIIDGDATITATFKFKSSEGSTDTMIKDAIYTFKLSDVKDSNTSTGMVAGRIYEVNVEIYNYVKFSGAPQLQGVDITNEDETTTIKI